MQTPDIEPTNATTRHLPADLTIDTDVDEDTLTISGPADVVASFVESVDFDLASPAVTIHTNDNHDNPCTKSER